MNSVYDNRELYDRCSLKLNQNLSKSIKIFIGDKIKINEFGTWLQ
jgi:hypothetical protein